MNVKIMTGGLFNPEVLVRLVPIKEGKDAPEPPQPADIGSSNMTLDIDEYANNFSAWAKLRCSLPIPKAPIWYDEIYNFSYDEKVIPITVYSLQKKTNIEEILIPLDEFKKAINSDGIIYYDTLKPLLLKYSIKLFLTKKELYDLVEIYTNQFLADVDFNYKDKRICK